MEASKKEPNILQTYEELKSDFENHACRVDDVLLYPVLYCIQYWIPKMNARCTLYSN